MHRILIAADKFKTTLTSRQVASALSAGIREVLPAAEVQGYVASDGGEGFLDAVAQTVELDRKPVQVTGPLGEPVTAELGIAAGGREIYLESCQANGFQLIADPADRDPLRTTSIGVGELIAAAQARRPEAIYVGLGSSATVDIGLPAARALGYTFRDRKGKLVEARAGNLGQIATIEWPTIPPTPVHTRIYGVVDVDNPPTGPEGGVRVYGPQKGAGPEAVELLEAGVANVLAVRQRGTDRDYSSLRGGGAAGCLGLGLVAFCGAELLSGSDFVIDRLGLRQLLEDHDVLVTGEGSFDQQSLCGKIPGTLLKLAAELGKPAFLVTGRRQLPDEVRRYTTACYSVEQLIEAGEIAGIEESERALCLHGRALAQALKDAE